MQLEFKNKKIVMFTLQSEFICDIIYYLHLALLELAELLHLIVI